MLGVYEYDPSYNEDRLEYVAGPQTDGTESLDLKAAQVVQLSMCPIG